MLRKIVHYTVVAVLSLAPSIASAQQVLKFYSDHCTPTPTGQALVAIWNNTSGQPTCSLSASHTGQYCYKPGFPADFVETETFNLHQHCITDWTYENYVTVTPACGGTPSQTFQIMNHTCCQ